MFTFTYAPSEHPNISRTIFQCRSYQGTLRRFVVTSFTAFCTALTAFLVAFPRLGHVFLGPLLSDLYEPHDVLMLTKLRKAANKPRCLKQESQVLEEVSVISSILYYFS